MLVDCPECHRSISERAPACPGCGFPMAEHIAEQKRTEEAKLERQQRSLAGEVDCPHCAARGFQLMATPDERGKMIEQFEWCSPCEHSGRLSLVSSPAGYFAVPRRQLDAFLAGELSVDDSQIAKIGPQMPAGHRYPTSNPASASAPPDLPKVEPSSTSATRSNEKQQ